MQIIFKDAGREVVWDLPDVNINQAMTELHSGDIACVPLDCELELIVNETTKLRNKLLEPLRGADGCVLMPDPIRTALVLLSKYKGPEGDPADLVTHMNALIMEIEAK